MSNSFKFNLNDIVQRVSKTLAQEPGAAKEQLHEDLEKTQSNPRGGDAAEADVQRAVAAQQIYIYIYMYMSLSIYLSIYTTILSAKRILMAQGVERLLRERPRSSGSGQYDYNTYN